MPELPEVARTVQSLNNRIGKSTLKEIIILSGRYVRHGDPKGLDDLREALPAKIESINFYGKLIIFKVIGSDSKPRWIWNTLGMSGGWRSEAVKHSHVELVTDKGSVFFTDPRNFGTIKIVSSEEETRKKISSIGPNHLSTSISDDLFKSRISRYPQSTIVEVLMNQNLIGGIGNYIKSEVLYRAGVSPHRSVHSITDDEFSRLNEETRRVVQSSYESRGASIHTFEGMDGEKGDFVFSFKVYGRKICEQGYDVVSEVTNDGRMTHWVPQIQK